MINVVVQSATSFVLLGFLSHLEKVCIFWDKARNQWAKWGFAKEPTTRKGEKRSAFFTPLSLLSILVAIIIKGLQGAISITLQKREPCGCRTLKNRQWEMICLARQSGNDDLILLGPFSWGQPNDFYSENVHQFPMEEIAPFTPLRGWAFFSPHIWPKIGTSKWPPECGVNNSAHCKKLNPCQEPLETTLHFRSLIIDNRTHVKYFALSQSLKGIIKFRKTSPST